MTRAPRVRSNPSSSPRPRRAPKPADAPAVDAPGAGGERVGNPRHVRLGDVVKVERRYVVDGSLTSVTDEGRFKGVQVLGSTEHLLLEDGKASGVRMIPLHTISEIIIMATAGKRAAPADAFDPSFA